MVSGIQVSVVQDDVDLTDGPSAEAAGGGAFLALLVAPFWAVHLREPARWWATIPGGVLASLGGAGALDALDGADDLQGGGFFLGLGLTSLLVGRLPAGAARRRWASSLEVSSPSWLC